MNLARHSHNQIRQVCSPPKALCGRETRRSEAAKVAKKKLSVSIRESPGLMIFTTDFTDGHG